MATAGDDRLRGGEESHTDEDSLVTTCGRRIAVRCLRLGRPDRPVSRIALDVGEDRGGDPGVWAALTPEEARGLAHLLLERVGAVENPAGGARPQGGSPSS
ncbi:hypothetical protein LK07_15530 [Streptomyces pluripotens]|uniref:Uncharacterized protein n=1 Tax=Streptomyces pluripotens TaxID=1355015 RepID=A0A221NZ71_9ACTN|nr:MULTISPECIES: hypothetical protein [Streptomyces]ARP70948.1 hypothetical protein LK06_014395 [Streptomyces pluripotens]ASN25202.1 hypothetical protein LK07_15530 [Streptomyces pluripotens]KIE27648.1 hypothetical protein LK08_07070 [Streptomyces sp. MUSC 125]MCH0559735.1 hypothetical protein [Streptomyces sp. MUM 16J]